MKHSVRNTESAKDMKLFLARNFFKPSVLVLAVMALFATFHPVKSFAGGRDTVPPVLIVNGPDTIYHEISTGNLNPSLKSYLVSAIDAKDANRTPEVIIDSSLVQTSVFGVYQVTYSVSDLDSNWSYVHKYVDIIDTGGVNPNVKPVIRLAGSSYLQLPRNYAYYDSGATASSAYFDSAQLDHRIAVTNDLNNAVLGTYTYTFNLTDSFGNVADSVTRTIVVIDNKTPAMLSLIANGHPVQVCLGSAYTDAGYTIYDPYYRLADITVTTVGTFSGTSTAGLYYLRYKATDPDGNVSYSDYRYINVLASNDDVCSSGAQPHEIDTLICKGSCPTLRAPVFGSSYAWSTGDLTLTSQICANNDTIVEVSITNGANSVSYIYYLGVSPAYESCVWPGDANADGVADNNDVLAIGIAYGDSGPRVRPNATINWMGQPSFDWFQTFPSGVDYKNADCDGNAFVDSLDITAIYNNYGLTHSKTGSNGSPSDPPLSVTFSNDSAKAGQTVTATLNLGTSSNPVANAYGIAFSLSYSSLYIKPGQAKANLNNSWLGKQGQNLIYFLRDDSVNQAIEVAITRTDHKEMNGYGELGKVNIVMQDNLGGKVTVNRQVSLTPFDVNLISYNQSPIPLYATGDSVEVTASISNSPSTALKDIRLYPNPASQSINIDPGNQDITNIRIVNELGMTVLEQPAPARGMMQIAVSQFNSGIYTVIISSKNGTATRQVLKN